MHSDTFRGPEIISEMQTNAADICSRKFYFRKLGGFQNLLQEKASKA
jgi:hypothetical protein